MSQSGSIKWRKLEIHNYKYLKVDFRLNTISLSLSLQMISAQKQLIENADTVQERIAQVQREGKVHRPVRGQWMAGWADERW